jgi:hypothetical protein
MTDTFRALCAELIAEIDQKAWGVTSLPSSDAIDRARAALAEPKPTFDEEWEQLKERLWDKRKTLGYQGEEFMWDSDFDLAMDEARTALVELDASAIPLPEATP